MAKSINGDIIKAGRLGDLQEVLNQDKLPAAAKKYSHLRVQLPSGEETSLLFTDYEIKKAIERAKKNPEDLPQVGWLRDLFD